jgi:hypothetical protein
MRAVAGFGFGFGDQKLRRHHRNLFRTGRQILQGETADVDFFDKRILI